MCFASMLRSMLMSLGRKSLDGLSPLFLCFSTTCTDGVGSNFESALPRCCVQSNVDGVGSRCGLSPSFLVLSLSLAWKALGCPKVWMRKELCLDTANIEPD
jgi:hypothetical protein